MLSNYIEKLQSLGKLSFTIGQATKDLNATYNSIKSAAYRLKKRANS